MTLRTLYQYVSSLTRPVRYHSETILHTPTVGADGVFHTLHCYNDSGF